jgi:NADPH:quinone reductase-like Zn-dependent oxidoreductase
VQQKPLPKRLFDQAASLPVGAITASEAMFRDQDTLPPGVRTVLIIGGAGAVGSLATQILKATTAAFVIATGSHPESRDWCAKMGADMVIDHSDDVAAQLAAANIRAIDMVLSTAGTADNLGWISKVLRPYGHIAFTDVVPPLDLGPMGPLGAKAPSLHMEMMFSRIVNNSRPERQRQLLQGLAALVSEGRVRPLLTTRLEGLTAESMKTAHELIEKQRTIGKIVVTV